jgi:hypothetical protein
MMRAGGDNIENGNIVLDAGTDVEQRRIGIQRRGLQYVRAGPALPRPAIDGSADAILVSPEQRPRAA